MKKLKKGFTLVELVIVIAVIAVLAAVLIPTFSGIVQKAKVSNDTTMVKSLNTIMTSVDVQGRPTSVAEAIDVVETDGIKISKLTATANGYKIVYDLEQNRFALLDGNNKVSYQDPNKEEIDTAQLYKLWKIVLPNQPANDKTFSMFLAGDNRTGTLNISTGVEVGENTGITQINYTNTKTAQHVVINTNSMWCTLTINAPSDEVEHHGVIGDLNIIAVKKGTYSEFGRVGGIAHLTYGAIKVNNGAELTTLVATPANDNANDVVLEVTNGGVVGTLIAPTQGVLTALDNSGVKHSEVVTPGTGETPQQAIEKTLNSVAYILHQNTRTYYASFAEACNAAETNDTVVVLKDYQYSAALKSTLVTIAKNKNVTLDLNGKIIQAVLDNSTSITMFDVNGNLTIMDSTAPENGIGSGSIETSVAYTADPWKVSAAVIKPQAGSSLIVNSGKLINRGGSGSYVIDTYQGSTTTINNGYIEGTQYNAIRMFCNSTTQTNTLTVNNGTFKAHYNCIWLQNPNGNANVATLTINNGTFMSEDDYNISIAMEWGNCYNYSAMNIVINSGFYDDKGIYLEYDCWNNSNGNAAAMLSINHLLDGKVTKGTEDWKPAS